MRPSGPTVLIAEESSGIVALADLVGRVVRVVEDAVDSDGDRYLVVRADGTEHLIYADQCVLVDVHREQ